MFIWDIQSTQHEITKRANRVVIVEGTRLCDSYGQWIGSRISMRSENLTRISLDSNKQNQQQQQQKSFLWSYLYQAFFHSENKSNSCSRLHYISSSKGIFLIHQMLVFGAMHFAFMLWKFDNKSHCFVLCLTISLLQFRQFPHTSGDSWFITCL